MMTSMNTFGLLFANIFTFVSIIASRGVSTNCVVMFRTPGCFELSWPMKTESKFLTGPKGRKRVSLVHAASFFMSSALLKSYFSLLCLYRAFLQ